MFDVIIFNFELFDQRGKCAEAQGTQAKTGAPARNRQAMLTIPVLFVAQGSGRSERSERRRSARRGGLRSLAAPP
jgi:hypothetical protein